MDVGTVIGYAITGSVALILGIVGYRAIPKKDTGNVANQTVDAAGKAMDLLEDSYERKIDDLETRVARLEEIILERDAELVKAREKIVRLEREIKDFLRWIAVLSEQVTKNGDVPITLDEIRHLDEF